VFAALKEKAKCPVPSKPFRLPPLATDRTGRGAQRAARFAKAEEPIVGLLNRGVSLVGATARESLAAGWARPGK
jgi:hypothetical protein